MSPARTTDDPINDLVEEFTNKTMNGDTQQPYVISMYHKNGTIKYIELSESRLNDPDGEFISTMVLSPLPRRCAAYRP